MTPVGCVGCCVDVPGSCRVAGIVGAKCMAGGIVLEDGAAGVHERALECPVCQKTLSSPKTLKCAHTLCEKCVVGLLKGQATGEVTCPECLAKTEVSSKG